MLRKCRVLHGAVDSFRTSEFEHLMRMAGIDCTTCRPTGKPQCFLKTGDKSDDISAVDKPKDMHSKGGVLEQMPVRFVHLPSVRTKISKRLAERLINGCTESVPIRPETKGTAESDKHNIGSMSVHINDLVDVVKKEMMCASKQGSNYSHTQRAERMLRKAAAVAIKVALRDPVDAWVDRIGDDSKKEAMECLSTLAVAGTITERTTSDLARQLFPASGETPNNAQWLAIAPLIAPPVDLTGDVDEEDESDVDVILSQMKE